MKKETKNIITEKVIGSQVVSYKSMAGAFKALATSLTKSDDIIFYVLDNIATGEYKLSAALAEAVLYKTDKNYRSVYGTFDSLVKALRLANKCYLKKPEAALNAFRGGNIGAVYTALKGLKKEIDALDAPSTPEETVETASAPSTPEETVETVETVSAPSTPEASRPSLKEIERLLKNVKTYKIEIMDSKSLQNLKTLLESLN